MVKADQPYDDGQIYIDSESEEDESIIVVSLIYFHLSFLSFHCLLCEEKYDL